MYSCIYTLRTQISRSIRNFIYYSVITAAYVFDETFVFFVKHADTQRLHITLVTGGDDGDGVAAERGASVVGVASVDLHGVVRVGM
jgi:hypothetical protein